MAGITTVALLPMADYVDVGEGGQAGADRSGYKGEAEFTLVALTSAGSTPTLAVKLQSGDKTNGERYTTVTGSHDVELREGATTNVLIGASFTQTNTASVKSVFLYLKKNGTVTETDLTLTIETDSSGDPDGTALGTATVSTDNVAATYGWIEFVFTNAVDLTAAGSHWYVLQSDYTASATNNVAWRASSGLTSGGNQSLENGTSWTADADDSQEFYSHEINFTDWSGAAFTTATTVAVIETLKLEIDDAKSYIRAHTTVTGTSTPGFFASVIMRANLNE